VNVRYAGGDRWENTSGLSFEDYTKCHKTGNKLFSSRRFETPDWALGDSKTATVIVAYLENRALSYVQSKQRREDGRLTLASRLKYAESVLLERNKSVERTVTDLCERYVALKSSPTPDPAVIKRLETLISNQDSIILFNRRPAAIVASLIYNYFRMGESSVATASVIGLRAPAVRQLVRRLWGTAEELGFPAPVKSRAQKQRVPIATNDNAARRSIRARRRADRLCACGQPPVTGKKMCLACCEYFVKYRKSGRAARWSSSATASPAHPHKTVAAKKN